MGTVSDGSASEGSASDGSASDGSASDDSEMDSDEDTVVISGRKRKRLKVLKKNLRLEDICRLVVEQGR